MLAGRCRQKPSERLFLRIETDARRNVSGKHCEQHNQYAAKAKKAETMGIRRVVCLHEMRVEPSELLKMI